MKKQLLFTSLLFVVSFATFSQIIVDPVDEAETVRASEIPGRVDNIIKGNFTTAGSGAHIVLVGDDTNVTNISADYSFTLETSSSEINTTLDFHVRKYNGNSGSIKIHVDGYTTETFNLPSASTDVDTFEQFNLIFSQTVTLSTTPINVKLEIVDIAKDLAKIPTLRFYNIKLIKSEVLSIDDVHLQNSELSVFPNPVTNSFQLKTNKSIESVKLYNITGRLLKTFNGKANYYDISDLATGMYIANIKTQSGSKTLRIVKK